MKLGFIVVVDGNFKYRILVVRLDYGTTFHLRSQKLLVVVKCHSPRAVEHDVWQDLRLNPRRRRLANLRVNAISPRDDFALSGIPILSANGDILRQHLTAFDGTSPPLMGCSHLISRRSRSKASSRPRWQRNVLELTFPSDNPDKTPMPPQDASTASFDRNFDSSIFSTSNRG